MMTMRFGALVRPGVGVGMVAEAGATATLSSPPAAGIPPTLNVVAASATATAPATTRFEPLPMSPPGNAVRPAHSPAADAPNHRTTRVAKGTHRPGGHPIARLEAPAGRMALTVSPPGDRSGV